MAESTAERIQRLSADKTPSWLTKWPEPIQRAIRKGTVYDVDGILYSTQTGNPVPQAGLRLLGGKRRNYTKTGRYSVSQPRPVAIDKPAPSIPLAVPPSTARDIPFNFPNRGNLGPLPSGVPG